MQFIANNEQICDAIMNAAILLICKETPTFNIQSTTLPASIINLAQLKPFTSIIMAKVTS